MSKFSVILNIFETEQLQIGNWVEMTQNSSKLGQNKTKLSCLVTSCVHIANTDKTRQDKTVMSCACRRCEQAISSLLSMPMMLLLVLHLCGLVIWSTLILNGVCCSLYSVSQEKVPTFELSVTLSNLNRFSKFLHCWKAYEICYKTHTTVPTSP